jgi:hypothetical protein
VSRFIKKYRITLTALILFIIACLAIEYVTRDIRAFYILKWRMTSGSSKKPRITISPILKAEVEKLTYSDQFVRPNDISKIVLITYKQGFSDQFATKRIQEAAMNNGWEAIVVGNIITEDAKSSNKQIIQLLKPDFVIAMHDVMVVEGTPHYLILHFPDSWFENTNLNNPNYPNILSYSGFLLSFGDERFINQLDHYFASHNKPFHHEQFYFSVSKEDSEFRELDMKRLFFCGTRWDSRRGGTEYKKLFNLLDQAGYFDPYGPKKSWTDIPSYKGPIAFDHKEFLSAIRKSGVGLIFHNKEHYLQNIPSTRIFELSAASAMIISEDMKFIKDNFGDNILYIDPSKSAQEIFVAIDKNMKWIIANPELAREKAKKANAIFQEKFTLEKLLLNVEKMHLKLQAR